jgi:cystathionine beta-lyase/cystathionine gamma-synthase
MRVNVPAVLCCAVSSGTEAALPLASGMAAISSTLLTLLKAGDHMLIQVGIGGGWLFCFHWWFVGAHACACDCVFG